jgi:hypothetical protein
MEIGMEQTVKNYRYERKFVISELSIEQVLGGIERHPAVFGRAYPGRYVNNIYFDSVGLNSYWAGIEGAVQRTKVRVRWYGSLFGTVSEASLELKIKDGLLGEKRSYPVEAFTLEEKAYWQPLPAFFENAKLPEILRYQLSSLRPVLMNRYYRYYYESADHKFRLTADTEMTYYKVERFGNSYLHQLTDRNSIIVEVKYGVEQARCAGGIINSLGRRLVRNSKYTNGIEKMWA